MSIAANKVGIVGYWFATNYGGVASYYSLYHMLEQLGYDPFLVENPYLDTDVEGYDVFSRDFFLKIHANITEVYSNDKLEELNSLADCFILGSDQVVTTSTVKSFGKLFLMDFLDEEKKRIGVSVSCGGDNLDDIGTIKYMRPLLKKFSAISVREISAVDIFKYKMGINVNRIIDPIFMCSAQDYIELTSRSMVEEKDPYLAAYILDPSEDKRQAIKETAAKLGLGIKVILDGRKNTHGLNDEKMGMSEVTLPEIDFITWLHYLSNASYIITDSFHGASMALIFNKPFIMFANHKRGYTRFLTLAHLFDIKNRLVDSSSEISDELLFAMPNFANINEVINQEKQNALDWLSNALEAKAYNEIKEDFKTPKYSLDLYQRIKNRPYDVCRKDMCTGCGACKNICPQDCIYMVPDDEGFLYPLVDKIKCSGCNMCKSVCPVINRNPNLDKRPIKVYAGFSNNIDTRYNSTSGGAFTEIARYVLKMSGVCYGAAYDDRYGVVHTRITSEKELEVIRQSKYVQSDTGDIYKRVKLDLISHLYVLFCGTPCQCAALKSYLGNEEYDKLIVVDFICHSICSPKAFREYLIDIERIYEDEISKVWFKNKETTWQNFSLRIDFKSKDTYYRKTVKEDNYFKAFLRYRVCARPSCHECQFKGNDRASDITLADYWGLKWKNSLLSASDMNDGVSLIILNSKKGKYIFDVFSQYQMYTEEHTFEEAIKGNGGYYHSERPGLYRDYFFANLGKKRFHEIVEEIDKKEKMVNKERNRIEREK